jgi:transcriptional regulator with XRE-family HTH domain
MYDKNNCEYFAARLQQLLDEKDMTQVEFAKRIGISKHTITNYKSGERIPRADILLAIAEFFGKPVEWFFPDEQPSDKVVAKETRQKEKPLTISEMHDILEKLMTNADDDLRRHISSRFKQAFDEFYQNPDEDFPEYTVHKKKNPK